MVRAVRVGVAALCSLVTFACLAACAGDEPSLNGTWTPTAYPVYPAFQNQVADDINVDASVKFTTGGTWTANDGCNDPYSGEYELASDGGFKFELPGGVFGVGCDGLIPWDLVFAYTDHVNVVGDTAILEDDENAPLLELTKRD